MQHTTADLEGSVTVEVHVLCNAPSHYAMPFEIPERAENGFVS